MENTEKKSLFKNWLIKRLLSNESTREEASSLVDSLDKSLFINQFLKSDFFSVFSIIYLKAELIIPNFFRIKTSFLFI